MRVVTRTKRTLTKQDFSDAMGVEIDKLVYKDSYFQAIVKQGDSEVSTYFRCSDVQGLLGLDYNIFDVGIKPVKGQKDTYEYFAETEHTRGKFSLGKLKRTLKKLIT